MSQTTLAFSSSDSRLATVLVRCRHCLDRALRELGAMPSTWEASSNERLRAQITNALLLGDVRREFDQDELVTFAEDRQLCQLIGPDWRMRFNKINRDGKLADNSTPRTAEWSRKPIPGIPELQPIWFVYRPDELWLDIETAQMQVRHGRRVIEAMDILPVDTIETVIAKDDNAVMGISRGYSVKPAVRQQRLREMSDAEFNEGTA